ncbi:guanylate kinase [Synechococcus elongatus]|uniref:Guanylate kinase n=1 Tax=Synechococcus elongatus (strain ATCC 33912 / PCC 7942 / FACHB-805) TaxID=1140 RepID=KGUA_SYNE7|nr:guanylate kinase [Synechococcus elongatus]Q8KPQ7.2 RecName: Full=Guanylate kinase; AltName: Full=GMP kinase [Synechococcus elongatus PCC 7942 = FACHB-805]ABB57221.1 guanylate kinase [Synechococcus elongatus PCC 7942 = FACHB-805]AJD58266.1 guanylate kinase [Synechococcus elongatus UTEX 2973]MBD2587626.1 guanylate kinase [Synechococcus elongatus FACHB-242]MBD2688595.1 guanylate kinase [Synechococcus elongatus FACHB-1061]MBD2707666.1 guanylate kinase [Synechococcus elongatus PCC 7942 = FACHB-
MSIGRVVVLTGPSGVGKGTLLKAILSQHPEAFLSISATTRSPRPGEVDGQHYYFLSREEFQTKIAEQEFLEWAEFAGNLYGTPRSPVIEQVNLGRTVILEIELEGARQVRKTLPSARQVMLLPPSVEELERRIRERATEDEAAIARRLLQAQTEIGAAKEFDRCVINDQLDTAITALEAAIFS